MSSLPTKPCSCPAPGWCERHGIKKHAHWHHLCQTKEAYRRIWDEGHGPGQLAIARDREAGSGEAREGWGDKVTTALKAIGITEERYKAVKEKFGLPPNCNCAGRREWLNKVGRWWNGEEE